MRSVHLHQFFAMKIASEALRASASSPAPHIIDFQIAGWNILWKYRGVNEGSSREGVYLNNDGEYYQAKTRIILEACIGPEFTGLLCDTAYPTFDEIGTPKGGYEGQKSW